MSKLSAKHCTACAGGEEPLDAETVAILLKTLSKDWKIGERGWLERTLTLGDFMDCVVMVRRIGILAEEEGHHPNLYIFDYKKLRIELYTHKINGLHENDFILAAKIDELTG